MNRYLAKSLTAVLGLCALGLPVGANAATDSTTSLADVQVLGYNDDWYFAADYFDFMIEYYNVWDDRNDEYASEGGGTPPVDCEFLRATKPDNCPSPIAKPVGPEFARDEMESGSGIPKLLYFITTEKGVHESARALARTSLANHTDDIAGGWAPFEIANSYLLTSVASVCEEQRNLDAGLRAYLNLEATPAERQCIEALEVLTAESYDNQFSGWFLNWLRENEIDLNDLGIPNTVIGLFDTKNSLRVKYDKTSKDAKCSNWWTNVQANQCGV